MKQFALVLVLAQCLASALAIQCFHCSYNTFDSSNPVLSTILTTLSKLSNDHCQLLVPNDQHELNVRNCPVARPGHVYKCGEIVGEVEAEFLEVFTVRYNTIERDCIEVPDDDSQYSDGCHDDLPSSGPVRNLIDQTFEGANLGDVTFTGEACYESDGIQVSGPMCPRCTWTHLETDNSALQWFLDGIQQITDDHCLFQDSDDYYEVNYHICPSPGYGEVAKCGDIDGRITGRILGVNFELTTLQRDCVTGPASEASSGSAFSDGCHDESGSNNIIAPLIEESYGSASGVSGGDFEGQACFSRYFAPLMAGSSTVHVHMGVVVLTVLVSLLGVLRL